MNDNKNAGQGIVLGLLLSAAWWGVAVWSYHLFGFIGPFGWVIALIGFVSLAIDR